MTYFESADPQFSDSDLLAILREREIEVIELWDTQVTDEGVRHMKKAHRLREVTLQGEGFTDHAMKALAECHSLESICIFKSSRISDKGILSVKSCKLSSLVLDDADITGKSLRGGMSQWNSMWRLGLNNTKISELHVEDAFHLPQLTLFSASNTNVTFALIERCGDNQLELLYLDDTRINNEGASRIVERFPRLRNLCLARTNISDSSLVTIAQLPSIELLRVSGSLISDSGLSAFIGHSTIQAIEASQCGISKRVANSLRESCPQLSRLIV